MASDQVCKEKVTVEREVCIDKDKVPKMTSHFESQTEKAKDSDLTGGKETPRSEKDRSDDNRDRSGNTVGEVGAPAGKARETHELGTHEFESLAEKVMDRDASGDKDEEEDRQRESYADKARSANIVGEKGAKTRRGNEEQEKTRGPSNVEKFVVSGEGRKGESEAKGNVEGHEEEGRSREMRDKEERLREKQRGGEMQGKDEGGEKQGQLSLEPISELRGKAQQSSMEALRSAEERYNQAKEEASHTLGSATEYTAEKGAQAKDAVVQAAKQTSHYVAEKGSQAKDTALEKGQQGYEAAKDPLYNAGETVKEYTMPKAEQAKDYALEKATQAKEAAVDTTKKVAGYTEEKAVAAKDTTVEGGKGAADYAGKVAADVKDRAAVAGWSTAHYTTEKAVEGTAAVAKAAHCTTEKVLEGTKAAARAVEGAAEYAGHKAVEMVSKPLGAAKEAAVSTGESMKEYTARKKEEAQRELEAKRGERQDNKGGQHESHTTEAQQKVEGAAGPITTSFQETLQESPEQGKQEKQTTEYREDQSAAGGVLQAIGETVVEIAKTTKDLVIGEGHTGKKELGYGSSQAQESYQGEAQRS